MHSILLLPLVAICLETIYVCIWGKFVFISVVLVVTVWGGGVCGNVVVVVEDSVSSLGVLKYVACLCKGVSSIIILTITRWSSSLHYDIHTDK